MFLNQYLKEIRWNSFWGMWAYVLHRLSGIILAAYLFVHILITSTARVSPESFQSWMSALGANPWVRGLEYCLLLAMGYHLFNGIRVIAIDWAPGWSLKHKKMLAWMISLFAITAVAALFAMWHHLKGLFGL